jgi:cation diffusion facilitator CzcD-associated flavoprotein CzcO
MDEARFGVKRGEHVPAEKVYQYIQAFAEDNGVIPLLRLNTKVEVAEKVNGGWNLQCRSTAANGTSYSLRTPKLIISTGLASRPKMPKFTTSPSFSPLIVHSGSFPSHFSTIVQPSKHTLILGGGKSAWDIAYACATQPDATATMLIRPSGKGPIWMSPPYVTPFKL